MATQHTWPRTVTTYQFDTDDEEWDAWKNQVPRSKSLDTRLRELMKADREGRVLPPDHEGDSRSEEYHDVVDEVVRETSVVDEIASGWDDSDERLRQRRRAAEAALELIQSRGELGKSTAMDELLPDHAVDGQNDETWWRKNVRPVLQQVATYSPGGAVFILDEPEA